MRRLMLFSERRAYAQMGRGRRLLHHVIWYATRPRVLWPLWRAYRQTWPRDPAFASPPTLPPSSLALAFQAAADRIASQESVPGTAATAPAAPPDIPEDFMPRSDVISSIARAAGRECAEAIRRRGVSS